MKSWGFLVRVVATALVATGLSFALPSSTATATDPLKVMIAGDSITVGIPGDYTWRYRLFNEFKRQRVPVDFVGPLKYPVGGQNQYLVRSGASSCSYTSSCWDWDHDAITGTQLTEHLNEVATNVEKYQPDVLIAAYGTNDLVFGRTVDQIIADWRTYIVKAQAAKDGHNLKIVLQELNSVTLPQRGELNQKLNALAAEVTTQAEPVVVAHTNFSGWNAKKHSYDGKHPTPLGESAIAQQVAWSLKGLGVLAASPRINWTDPEPWAVPLSAKMAVKAKTRQVALSWGNAKYNIRAQYMRVRFIPLTGAGREKLSGFSRYSDLTTAKMVPGSYQVQLQARRGYMLSPWTAIGHVKIKPTKRKKRG